MRATASALHHVNTMSAPESTLPVAGPRDTVLTRLRNEIDVFRATVGRSSVHRQLKRATELTAQEYGNRFLVELIQNAHDALEVVPTRDARDGRIAIALDTVEGPFGTLYVANTGQGFTGESFRAICEFAQSSKRPGESIGNKGVGFRSVLQISDSPEIYSRAATAVALPTETFNGFCFRFATDGDLNRYLADPELVAELRTNVSPYSLPFPIDEQPSAVKRFAQAAFATVVRLPLHSAQALDDVKRAVTSGIESDAPIPLFLDRVNALTFECRGGDAPERHVRFTRSANPFGERTVSGVVLSRVTLSYAENDDTSAADFLVASLSVPERDMLAAIHSSVRGGKLPTEWEQWTGDGRVSIGVAVDGAYVSRLYNYLPMGTAATCPFEGILDAPFYAKLDRTTLDPDIPLNGFLLDCGATACVRFAMALVVTENPAYGPAVACLLAWSQAHRHRLLSASEVDGLPLHARALFPIANVDDTTPQRYAPLADIAVWFPPPTAVILTPNVLGRKVGVAFLDPRIEPLVRDRLAEVRRSAIGSDFTPPPALQARWAERLAHQLVADGAPLTDWDAFYADLSIAFRDFPSQLQGRHLILDDRGGLLRAGRVGDAATPVAGPTVFLAPVRERTDGEEEVEESLDVEVPDALRPFARYAHAGLRWRRPGTEASVRPFYVQHRLVRRFGRRELREFLRSLLAADHSGAVYAASLDFAYRIISGSPEAADPSPEQLRLRVPVRRGVWLPANDAAFSEGWGSRQASRLRELTDLVGDASPELQRVAGDVLVGPSEWPFAISDRKRFADFLAQIGVRHGLWPRAAAVTSPQRPSPQWTAAAIGREVGLAPESIAAWSTDVRARGKAPKYTGYVYELTTAAVGVLPGQDGYHRWPHAARLIFADLVADGFGQWPEHLLWCTFAKVGGNSDRLRWPSPVLAWLTQIAWVPVVSGSDDAQNATAIPADTWFARDDGVQLPDWLPSPPVGLRRAVWRSPELRARLLELLHVRFWDDPAYARAAVATLGHRFDDGAVATTSYATFASVYADKWRDALKAEDTDELYRLTMEMPVVVRRGGRLEVWDAQQDNDTLILQNDASPIRAQLLEQAGAAVLAIDGLDPARSTVLRQLRVRLGMRARLTSEIAFEVHADGRPVSAADDLPTVRETPLASVSELACLLVAVGGYATTHQAKEAAIERIRRIHVRVAERIDVTVDGFEHHASAQLDVLACVHETFPTIVVSRALYAGSAWSPRFARAVCDLAGLPTAATDFELALWRAARWTADHASADLTDPFPLEFACDVLQVSEARIREGLALTDRSTAALARLLAPVICYVLEEEWSDAWWDVIHGATTLDALRAIVAKIADRLPIATEAVLDACRSGVSVADIRDRLELEYGRFNRALRRLGRGYKPIVDPEGHATAFRSYLARSHVWIDDEVRRRCWTDFVTHAPLTVYVAARARTGLSADPTWLDVYSIPPDLVMREHVYAWIARLGAPTCGDRAVDSLDEVRTANRQMLDAFQPTARDVVFAWCAKHDVPVPPLWAAGVDGRRLTEHAFQEGWTDFAFLDEPFVIRQLVATTHWPTGMPERIDLAGLALSPEETARPRQAHRDERARRDQERRSVTIDGASVRVDREDYRALADAVLATPPGALLEIPDRLAELRAGLGSTARTSSGGGRRAAAGQATLTDEQRLGIGFVGELIVREWLRHQYPELDIDMCWRSGYKNAFLGRTDGDDSLGFDFEVIVGSRRKLYEVKASTGQDWQFALGESEVREAQRASADKRTRYTIVFVANALDSTRRRLVVLPNPFSARGADRLRMVGTGMRFKFELQDGS